MVVVMGAAVLYVKDLSRMRSFYQGCFRMEVMDEAQDYCVLESRQWTLSLVSVPEPVASTIVLSAPPARRADVPIKLAYVVDDIESLRPRFAELGGVVDPSGTLWEFRGSLRLDGVDPEGNVLQLVQAT
jgi:predicted enzyme related to lactoylglutathione lyase